MKFRDPLEDLCQTCNEPLYLHLPSNLKCPLKFSMPGIQGPRYSKTETFNYAEGHRILSEKGIEIKNKDTLIRKLKDEIKELKTPSKVDKNIVNEAKIYLESDEL